MGFKPITYRLEICYSIQLSYGGETKYYVVSIGLEPMTFIL